MKKRARVVSREDGIVETASSKYNGKYLFGNLLVCGACRASYRRRTERGKVVWRCARRIEKGKDTCASSPTINEEWLKAHMIDPICDGTYDECVLKRKVNKIKIYEKHILIKRYDEVNTKICL